MLRIVTFALLSFLTGCASIDVVPPKKAQIETDRIYNLDYHSTWVQAVDWFANHNVVIEKIEKESGLLTAKHLLAADNEFLDCGEISPSGSFNDSLKKTGSLNVTVRRINDKQTKIHVNFFGRFEYSGQDAWDGRWIKHEGNCVSTGAVEISVLSSIKD